MKRMALAFAFLGFSTLVAGSAHGATPQLKLAGLKLLLTHASSVNAESYLGANQLWPEYYLSTYADLRQAFGNDARAAIKHWRESGIREGRSPNPFFDPRWYLAKYPDLKNAFSENYEAATLHWYTCGLREGRQGCKAFAPADYLAANPKVLARIGERNYDGAFRAASTQFLKGNSKNAAQGEFVQMCSREIPVVIGPPEDRFLCIPGSSRLNVFDGVGEHEVKDWDCKRLKEHSPDPSPCEKHLTKR